MINLTEKIEERGEWWWPTHDKGCWDYMHSHADVPQKLAKHVKERGVVVQAGGNVGFYIRQYAELFDTVYTFEPDPLCFLSLCLNCDTPNVVKFQACVGDRPGFHSLGHWASDVGATHIAGKGILPTMRIDDLGLEKCDLIQLDTEGFEYYGLVGAIETIKKFKPVLSIEWWEEWATRYGVTLKMIEDLILPLGYELVAEYWSDRVYAVK
jgi:FkbM family methyltransferase